MVDAEIHIKFISHKKGQSVVTHNIDYCEEKLDSPHRIAVTFAEFLPVIFNIHLALMLVKMVMWNTVFLAY